EPGAGLEQKCQVAREYGDVLGARLAEKIKGEARSRRAVAFARCIDRNKTEIFDLADHLGSGRGRNRTADDLAGLRQSPIVKVRHNVTAARRRAAPRPAT